MEKKKNLQMGIIGVLAVAVLFMAIGFAAYSQTLNIQGNVAVKKSVWSIHWDDSTYSLLQNSKPLTSESGLPTITNNTVTFQSTLDQPGDFVAFQIDAVNDGTIDAELKKITLTSSVNADYLGYEVTYDDTTYTQTTDNLSIGLDHEESATVTVKVSYLEVEASALPQNDVNVTVTASFDYEQVQ